MCMSFLSFHFSFPLPENVLLIVALFAYLVNRQSYTLRPDTIYFFNTSDSASTGTAPCPVRAPVGSTLGVHAPRTDTGGTAGAVFTLLTGAPAFCSPLL